MADQEQGAQGREWDPRAHLERVHAALPEDGSILPIADLAAALGCKSTNSCVAPLHFLCWSILGVRIHRRPNGEYIGVSRFRDWSRGGAANAALAKELGFHGAAPTPTTLSESPPPASGASQNRRRYSRD